MTAPAPLAAPKRSPIGADCFGKFKHRWITRQIDSRTSKMANKAQIQK